MKGFDFFYQYFNERKRRHSMKKFFKPIKCTIDGYGTSYIYKLDNDMTVLCCDLYHEFKTEEEFDDRYYYLGETKWIHLSDITIDVRKGNLYAI